LNSDFTGYVAVSQPGRLEFPKPGGFHCQLSERGLQEAAASRCFGLGDLPSASILRFHLLVMSLVISAFRLRGIPV